MAIAAGTEVYNVDHAQLVARGATLAPRDVQTALQDDVGAVLADDPGRAHLTRALGRLATTKFQTRNLQRVLDRDIPVTDWRVGEAIAECFLKAHRQCEFPWPHGRDLRNPNASPAGADLVGFQTDRKGPRLAFGEAKTSSDAGTPPNVMFGRTGLVRQLETLRDDLASSAALVAYLAHRKEGSPWQATFDAAATRYFANPADISLFGIMVRDTSPRDLDLKNRARSLASTPRPLTTIELRAIYLPSGSLATLAKRASAALGRRK